jgi:hypothetical protein
MLVGAIHALKSFTFVCKSSAGCILKLAQEMGKAQQQKKAGHKEEQAMAVKICSLVRF